MIALRVLSRRAWTRESGTVFTTTISYRGQTDYATAGDAVHDYCGHDSASPTHTATRTNGSGDGLQLMGEMQTPHDFALPHPSLPSPVLLASIVGAEEGQAIRTQAPAKNPLRRMWHSTGPAIQGIKVPFRKTGQDSNRLLAMTGPPDIVGKGWQLGEADTVGKLPM